MKLTDEERKIIDYMRRWRCPDCGFCFKAAPENGALVDCRQCKKNHCRRTYTVVPVTGDDTPQFDPDNMPLTKDQLSSFRKLPKIRAKGETQ